MSHPRRGAVGRAGRSGEWRWVAALLLACAVAVAWGGWQAWQGAQALQRAADGLQGVQDDLDGAADRLRAVAAETDSARERLENPLVAVLSAVPRAGDPLRSAVALARAADLTVREALLPLLDVAGDDPTARLTRGAGAVDVDYLASMAAPSAHAAQRLDDAAVVLAEAPTASGVARVDEAVHDLGRDLHRLRDVVDDVARALDVAPELLGQDGARRYLVVSQSPAEARGTGGLIGGYSLLEVNAGAFEIVRSGARTELQSPGEPVEYFSQEYDEHYGPNAPTSGWINSNLSPHFPYAARIWQALWERQHGEQLDGALVLDPVALSYLLEATGPVDLADGTPVSADRIVDLTMRDVYTRFGGDPAGDDFLQEISTAVALAVTTRDLGGQALVTALASAVDERRLLLWSADERVQERLADSRISGGLPEGQRTVGSVIVDAAGAKLDYYLERDLAYEQGCGEPSRLAVALTNAAPASGLPDYVTPEPFRRGEPPGTNIVLATLYLPTGSRIGEVTLDGAAVHFRHGTELGAVWVEALVTLRPGERQTLAATFTEPEGDARALQRIDQPLVRAESFTASTC